MIRLRILEILKEQNKSRYWLNKQLGLSFQNFSRMVNGETNSIRFDNIEKLCKILNCSVSDLFEITDDTKDN